MPDPTRYISSRHFEIRLDNGGYVLTDCSTNGTMLAATGERFASPHRIADGHRLHIASYVIAARLTGQAEERVGPLASSAAPAWQGWDADAPSAHATNDAAFPMAAHGWDAPPPSGTGSSAGWRLGYRTRLPRE
ncbi:FHA domain-containing protein [Sphingomonas sp. HMP9]|uniref:FHA domain-containing protein n=1 Tax=Sphingomonas sp. HMP9 TaxID=1517554 RepID=UPI00159705D5